MKTIKALVVLAMAAMTFNPVSAQVSYTRSGNTTYGSNGTTYTRSGNTTYGSNGTSYTQSGNTTYGLSLIHI